MDVAYRLDIASGRIYVILGTKHCLVFFCSGHRAIALMALAQWGQRPKPHLNYRNLQCVLTMDTHYDTIK